MNNDFRPTGAWECAEPTGRNLDSEKLGELEPAIRAGYKNIHGIAVVQNGAIVYEKYFHGFGPEDRHHVASVTKSVLSALVGIAEGEGAINSIDQRVMEFFPEYIPGGGEGLRERVTLRHLLTMTAPYAFEDLREPLDGLSMSPDWVQFALDSLGKNGRLGDFKYSTQGAHLLSAILTRTTGLCAREYANERLFSPAGMTVIPDYPIPEPGFDSLFGKGVRGWVSDPQGNSAGGWGLTLTVRDMARFGLLYLRGGAVDGRQIIPAEWVADSTAENPRHYGYLWWLREENGLRSFAAMGDGGNMISCIPEKDLAVAVASGFDPAPRDRWELIRNYILPVWG